MIINDDEITIGRSSGRYFVIGGAIVIIVVILILFFVLTGKHEAYSSEERDEMVVALLDCESSKPENPFFVSRNALDSSHEVKIAFRSGKPEKFSYNYYGSYSGENTADVARSEMHARYNIYMAESSSNPENLFPTFKYYGSDVKINLYAELDDTLDRNTARIFFLDVDEYDNIDKYTIEGLADVYASKGFVCSSSKNDFVDEEVK